MTSMRAAVYETNGSSDVLAVRELDAPSPGPGEVRVRVHVSGVNPTDWKARANSAPAELQIPNQDGAGVIDAVGAGVDAGRVGERVWVYFAAWQRPWGTAAQYTVVPAAQAVALPEGVSFDLGASVGIPAMTAHRCLFADGPVDGLTVLVAGGAGAVGHAAIQLARAAGARVIATVSGPEKAAIAQAAGAHAVVNYRSPDAVQQIRAAAPDGVDRIVEVALRDNLALDLAVAAPNAVITTYADDGSGAVPLTVRGLMTPNLVLRFVLVYTIPPAAIDAAVQGVTTALRDGVLTTLPLHRFPLDQTAAAHDAVERGAVGKVLIDVD
jgi:NADPH2:quinone reductase